MTAVRARPTCRTGAPLAGVQDAALDEALVRIAELTGRLHAVVDLHSPRRTVLGGRLCRACARPFPCPTVQQVSR